jgi:hypothetical protein
VRHKLISVLQLWLQQANFFRDQSGMHRQLLTMDMMLQFMDPSLYKHLENTDSFNLFFCFRWLLVWFKREFSWDDILSLWDVLFTDHLSTQFHLFVALAILDQHRNVIMDHLKHFDEILKVSKVQDKLFCVCAVCGILNSLLPAL